MGSNPATPTQAESRASLLASAEAKEGVGGRVAAEYPDAIIRIEQLAVLPDHEVVARYVPAVRPALWPE